MRRVDRNAHRCVSIVVPKIVPLARVTLVAASLWCVGGCGGAEKNTKSSGSVQYEDQPASPVPKPQPGAASPQDMDPIDNLPSSIDVPHSVSCGCADNRVFHAARRWCRTRFSLNRDSRRSIVGNAIVR